MNVILSLRSSVVGRGRSLFGRASLVAGLVLVSGASLAASADDVRQAIDSLAAREIAVSPESLVQYAAQGDLLTVTHLLSAGVNASAPERARQVTAAHNAAATGQTRVLERLLDAGANVDAQDWRGITPLINAAHGGHLRAVTLLLEHKASANLKPKLGPTALVAAVQAGHLAIVQALVARHADVNLADCFGTTPLAAARRSGRNAIAQFLERAGASL